MATTDIFDVPHGDFVELLDRQRRRAEWLRIAGIAARREALARLHGAVAAHRETLARAVARDLGKPSLEIEVSELWPFELAHREFRRHLSRWMRPTRVDVPWPWLGAQARIRLEPKGTVLILSPWNYPLTLTLIPLLEALAAGNTVVLKPSEHAPATATALAGVLGEAFPDDWVAVVTGDETRARALLELGFDHVFFTGSGAVGAHVRETTARTGSSCTLELGGKSPALILDAWSLERAARAIVWGKWLNAGQTCIAPDYVLVPESAAGAFLQALVRAAKAWGLEETTPMTAVHPRAHRRIETLLSAAGSVPTVTIGRDDPGRGRWALRIFLDPPSEGPLGREELFLPVLPVWSYRTHEEALSRIASRGAPLVCYLFGGNRTLRRDLEARIAAGAVVSGTTLVHFLMPGLPFGGRGPSGVGAYHGRTGFENFSQRKALLREPVDRLVLFRPWNGRRVRRLVAWLRRSLGRSYLGALDPSLEERDDGVRGDPHQR